MKRTSKLNRVAILAALSIAFVTANVALSAIALPSVLPTASVAAKGGSGSGGGSTVSLPADWPASVPTPAGKLFAASGSISLWSASITVNGEYVTAMNSLRSLYVNAGFTDLSPDAQVPFEFENTSYRVQVVGTAHDHSATSTDVTIHVILK